VKDNRPVNLDTGVLMRLPITAWTSITHRVTGVFLFLGMFALLWALDLSLSSEQGFEQVLVCLQSPIAKLLAWAICAAMIYHTFAGIKHLIMDLGIGESFEGGVLGARIVIALSVVFTILAGVWIW